MGLSEKAEDPLLVLLILRICSQFRSLCVLLWKRLPRKLLISRFRHADIFFETLSKVECIQNDTVSCVM